MIICGFLINSLYHLHINIFMNVTEQKVNAIGSKRSRDKINLKYIQHLRLGYIGEERIRRLEKYGLLGPLATESYLIYEFCLPKKMMKLPFVGQKKRTIKIFVLVHNDVCGPFDVSVRGGYLYFIIFINDYSWYRYVSNET